MNITYTLMLPCARQGESGFTEEEEIDVEFKIEADIIYEPARLGGPPEDCYPDYSECDITAIYPLDKIDGLTDADLLDALEKQVGTEKIEEDLWEDYMAKRFERA